MRSWMLCLFETILLFFLILRYPGNDFLLITYESGLHIKLIYN